MRRNLVIVALALGTVLGFASGFAHLHGWRHCGHFRHGCEHVHRNPASPPPVAP